SSNALTVEAWIAPRSAQQGGPARIVTLSSGFYSRNFTLGQGEQYGSPADNYIMRVRSNVNDPNGMRSILSPRGAASTSLTHLVFTRDANGNERLYINGQQVSSQRVSGSMTTWDSSFRLALGD